MEDGRKHIALQWKKTKRSNQVSFVNWAELPAPAVDVILDKLNLYDYVNFGAVCMSWRSIALDQRNHRGIVKKKKNQPWEDDHQLPLLMIPNGKVSGFYSVTQKSLILGYNLDTPLYTTRLIGCSIGWIISVDNMFSIALSNPFSPSSPLIRLPPILNLKQLLEDNVSLFGTNSFDLFGIDSAELYQSHSFYYIAKAVLSANPVKDCVLMVIYGVSKRLAFIRLSVSASSWIYLDSLKHGFSDVIYSKSTGLFHAVCYKTGEVCSIKIHEEGDGYDCCVTTPILKIEGKRDDYLYLRYIVETCEGVLLQVVRSLKACEDDLVQVILEAKNITTCSTDFKIYKLNEKGEGWREVMELGDNALFLGDSASVSVAPSQFSKRFCCAGEIYFLLPYFFHLLIFGRQIYVSEMGVVNIQQKQDGVQAFRLNLSKLSNSRSPPIWIIPTFQGTSPCKKEEIFQIESANS